MSFDPTLLVSALSRHASIWIDLFAHILAYEALPTSSSSHLPRRSASCMASMHRQSSSPTKPARLAHSLRRAISVGHPQDRRQPPSRRISVHFPDSPPSCERWASIATREPSSSRPSLHQRSASAGSVPTGILSRKRLAHHAFHGPSPTLSPTLSETPHEFPVVPSPTPSVVAAGAERSVVVVSGPNGQAAEMSAQVGVWEEQDAPGWAAYEHAVASAGVWEHQSVGASKDPFATAAPSYIAGPRPAGARGRRELAVDTLVSSNTAYIMASMAGSLDSDSADGSTLVPNSPASVSPKDKRASVVSAAPSTRARFTSRLQRAMRKLRGSSVV